MSRTAAARRPPLVAVAFALAGVAYFVGQADAQLTAVRKPALALLFATLIVHVIRRADPAWLLSAGIAAAMFSGNWGQLGLGANVAPDRVLLASGLAALILKLGRARDRPAIELRGIHFLLGAAFAYALISAILVGSLGSNRAGTFALIDQFGALPFVLFTVAPVAFREERQRQILLGTLVATGAYLSLTALFEKLHLGALLVPSYIGDPAVGIHFGRARGPFVDSVADGLALYDAAVAGAIAFVVWRGARARALAAGVTILSLAAVVMTLTRSVWLGAGAATALAIVAAPQLRRFALPLAGGAVALVLVAFALIPGLGQQAQQRQSDKSPVWERQNSDAAALRMVAARPLVGFGWYRHNDDAEPYFRLSRTIPLGGQIAGLHNLLLTYAVDLGIVGFGLWLASIAIAFGGAARRRAPPAIEPWRIGLFAIVTCYVAASLFGPVEFVYPTLLLWAWAGVVYQARLHHEVPG